jgi:hypothetical protein
MKDAATKSTTTKVVGLAVVVWCIERGLQYNFSRQMNIYLFFVLHENLNKSK